MLLNQVEVNAELSLPATGGVAAEQSLATFQNISSCILGRLSQSRGCVQKALSQARSLSTADVAGNPQYQNGERGSTKMDIELQLV